MKTIISFSVLFFLTVFCLSTEADKNSGYLGADIEVIELDQAVQDYANPFLLRVAAGDTVQFSAVNGQFGIFIRNANLFFENVGSSVKISLDSNDSRESQLLIVRSDLRIDSEIKYEVHCISQDGWADAPPRIIITSAD